MDICLRGFEPHSWYKCYFCFLPQGIVFFRSRFLEILEIKFPIGRNAVKALVECCCKARFPSVRRPSLRGPVYYRGQQTSASWLCLARGGRRGDLVPTKFLQKCFSKEGKSKFASAFLCLCPHSLLPSFVFSFLPFSFFNLQSLTCSHATHPSVNSK